MGHLSVYFVSWVSEHKFSLSCWQFSILLFVPFGTLSFDVFNNKDIFSALTTAKYCSLSLYLSINLTRLIYVSTVVIWKSRGSKVLSRFTNSSTFYKSMLEQKKRDKNWLTTGPCGPGEPSPPSKPGSPYNAHDASRSVTAVYKINSRCWKVVTLWRKTNPVLGLARLFTRTGPSVVHRERHNQANLPLSNQLDFSANVDYHVKSAIHLSGNWRLIFKKHDKHCHTSILWV